jgi:hypothetical protein
VQVAKGGVLGVVPGLARQNRARGREVLFTSLLRPAALGPERSILKAFLFFSPSLLLDRCSALEVEKKLLKTAFQPVPRR